MAMVDISLVPQAPPRFSMLHAEKREGAWYLIPRDSRNDDVAWLSKNVSIGKLSISWHQLSLPWWLPLLSSLEGSSFTRFKAREYCVQRFVLERSQPRRPFVSPTLNSYPPLPFPGYIWGDVTHVGLDTRPPLVFCVQHWKLGEAWGTRLGRYVHGI